VSAVEVDAAQVRVRMGSFKLDIPRSSVRSVQRSLARVGGTAGVHGKRGRWLVYGLGPSRVDQLTVSLDDPDGFIAAVGGDRTTAP
jgi:hypothetical protein